MNDADINRLVEQIRASASASRGSDPGGSRAGRVDSDDATVPLLTEIVRPEDHGSERRETNVPGARIPGANTWDRGTRELRLQDSAVSSQSVREPGADHTPVPRRNPGSAPDEAWVVALEARIVEQVIERLQTSAQPLLDTAFDELLAQHLARFASSLATELRGALEERLHDELGARIREAVHEAVWDAIDHKEPPQRHL